MISELFGEHYLPEYVYTKLLTIYHKQNKLPEWKEGCFNFISAVRKKLA